MAGKKGGKYQKDSNKSGVLILIVAIVTVLILAILATVYVICNQSKHTDVTSAENIETVQMVTESQNEEIQEYSESTSAEVSYAQYTLDGIKYRVPENWVVTNSTDSSTVFQIDDNEKNIVYIKSEEIPAIMKVDVGDNSILDKEDVAEHYGLHIAVNSNILEQAWTNCAHYDYCNILFNLNAKLKDGTQDIRTGRSIVFAISRNESVFAVSILSLNAEHLDYADDIADSVILSLEKSPISVATTETPAMSAVESAYLDACSLTEKKLEPRYSSFLDKTYYYYDGIIIQSEDLEFLEMFWNKDKALDQGCLYRSMANYLEGFSMKINNGSGYSELLCGQPWVDRDSFAPYAENASTFIITDPQNQLQAIMKKLQSVSSVTGEFDFNYGAFGKYNIDIPDLTRCAEEMQISEKMLGYIFALLAEYAPEITFDNNSCHIEYASYV